MENVGRLLFAKILLVYVCIASIGTFFLSIAIAVDEAFPVAVRIIMGLTGLVIFYAVYVICGEELETQRKLIETHIEREQLQIQSARQDLEPQAIGKITHVARVERRVGDDIEEQTHDLGTNIPSDLFIGVCYQQSLLSARKRVPERKIFELGEFPQADAWFDQMERLTILVKEGDYPNAPRRWNTEFTLERARQAFGYGAIPSPTAPVSR